MVPVVADGMACHAFVSWILVPQEPCDHWLLVEIVVFPTQFPPGAQWGAAILVTGGSTA